MIARAGIEKIDQNMSEKSSIACTLLSVLG
jgi:hypothetical protein